MFHMLSCFNLKHGVTIDDFRDAIANYTEHLKGLDLVHSTGPIGRRQTDTIMDTDSERDLEYYFIMSFSDRAQCDRSVKYIFPHEEPADSIHKAVYSKVEDPVFICWEDIQEG